MNKVIMRKSNNKVKVRANKVSDDLVLETTIRINFIQKVMDSPLA
jgi:hypothetical protein